MTRVLQIAFLGVAALLAATLGLFYIAGGREGLIPLIQIGSDFRLASSNGGAVDAKDLKGKPYAVFFGFTHCPEVCPTTLYEMSNTLAKLGDAAKDFRVFFITVDPERDTAAMLKDYLANFDPRIEALVPNMEQLPKVAADFHVYYAKSPTSDGSYTMDHTATLFLLDENGLLASTISFGEAPDVREAKIRKLLGRGR